MADFTPRHARVQTAHTPLSLTRDHDILTIMQHLSGEYLIYVKQAREMFGNLRIADEVGEVEFMRRLNG